MKQREPVITEQVMPALPPDTELDDAEAAELEAIERLRNDPEAQAIVKKLERISAVCTTAGIGEYVQALTDLHHKTTLVYKLLRQCATLSAGAESYLKHDASDYDTVRMQRRAEVLSNIEQAQSMLAEVLARVQ